MCQQKIDVEKRKKWRELAVGTFMFSALGEYTPHEFIELLDAYEALLTESGTGTQPAGDAHTYRCTVCGMVGSFPAKPFLTPEDEAELAKLEARGVKWIQSAAQPADGALRDSESEALAKGIRAGLDHIGIRQHITHFEMNRLMNHIRAELRALAAQTPRERE